MVKTLKNLALSKKLRFAKTILLCKETLLCKRRLFLRKSLAFRYFYCKYLVAYWLATINLRSR
ncbi:hypothetical protein DMC01_11665 [Campylobacter troglodytis]|nr:hypothetical protein DMC01_11665 [Campylobacter troglodytis]